MSEPDPTTNSAAPASGEGQDASPSAAPSDPPSSDRLAEALAEAARLRDQLLRTAADFDNYRKRSRRELDDATRRGKETAVKDLLPVFDNFERALNHAAGTAEAKSVADGLRIVLKQFTDTLEKLGIQRIVTVGQPFDPSVHEAIQHMESADQPAGVVVFEVQPGYRIGDYLLRAAMVVVSKGPPGGGDPMAH